MISGASFCTTASVRQSKDCTAARRSIFSLRITSMKARANTSGVTVRSGCSGEILVSMLKRTVSLPLFLARANTSASRGMGVPSTACCRENRLA
ncbi:hypothetical protein D3C83_30620 [compost metagenome]